MNNCCCGRTPLQDFVVRALKCGKLKRRSLFANDKLLTLLPWNNMWAPVLHSFGLKVRGTMNQQVFLWNSELE